MSGNTYTTVKVALIGNNGSGKSSLCIRLVSNKFITKYIPAIEDSFRYAMSIDGEHVMVNIMDTAWLDEPSQLKDMYVRIASGFMLVFSVDSRASFEEVNNYYKQIINVKQTADLPIILVGNKSDLPKESWNVTTEEAQQYATANKMIYLETSAKEDINVSSAFETLVRAVVNKYKDNLLNMNQERRTRKKGCCRN